MAVYNDIWGPKLHHYSLGFDLSTSESSSSDFSGVWKGLKVIPMRALESYLSRFDLNKEYFGDQPLAALISTLQNYHRASNHRIFKNYYGFLCIRCLMHIVCVGILLEAKTLDAFLESLDENLGWKEVCSSIAHETTRQAMSSIRSQSDPITRARFEAVFQSNEVLSSVGGITPNDCSFVLRSLWEDRASFLTLCQLKLLPGGPMLLYLLSRILLAQPGKSRQLVTPPFWAKWTWTTVELWRARTLHCCAPESQRTTAQIFDLDIMGMLLTHVSSTLRRDPSTKKEKLTIAEKTMTFLWLIMAQKMEQPHPNRPLADFHTYVRTYAAFVLELICKTQVDFGGTHEERYKFVQMLVKTDVIALAGRVLLLMTEEGDPFKELDWNRWNFFIGVYPQLCATYKKAIPVAPHLFTDSMIAWTKVLDQLSLFARLGYTDGEDANPALLQCMVQMAQAWMPFGEPFRADDLPKPQPCAYPRCFQPFTHEKTLAVRFTCGRCGSVAYCGLNCQRAHWSLTSINSHRLECVPSRTGELPDVDAVYLE